MSFVKKVNVFSQVFFGQIKPEKIGVFYVLYKKGMLSRQEN